MSFSTQLSWETECENSESDLPSSLYLCTHKFISIFPLLYLKQFVLKNSVPILFTYLFIFVNVCFNQESFTMEFVYMVQICNFSN